MVVCNNSLLSFSNLFGFFLVPILLSMHLPPLSAITSIDNEIAGNPMVICEETMITVTFKTKKPFHGRVYVQGMADDERCSRNFAANSDQSKFSMMIQNGDCATKRERVTGTLEGIMLSLTIVVSFHGTFVTRSDRAFRCMCFFKNVKHLTSAIDVNLIGTTELIDTAKTPSCIYSIHAVGPDGPPVGLGKVGDKIFHVWQCDDPTHGFLVHSCSVEDGRGSKFDLVDVDGCAIDPIIQPDIQYDAERNRASVETFGYKFSDTTILNYQCTVELCKKSSNECEGLTPPICGRQKRHVRAFEITPSRKVANRTTALDRIGLTASLKIIETNFDDTMNTEVLVPQAVLEKNHKPAVETASSTTSSAAEFDVHQMNLSTTKTVSRDCLRMLLPGFSIGLIIAASLATLVIVLVVNKRKKLLLISTSAEAKNEIRSLSSTTKQNNK